MKAVGEGEEQVSYEKIPVMTKLWKRVAGTLKDRNSVWLSTIRRRTSYRNPDLEVAVIKATSHDESRVDYKNAQRVFQWVRTTPAYLKPAMHAISIRMQKTRSWVVAIKGLMLLHGIFCCRIPAARRIGRLPFDLSNFVDGYHDPVKYSGFNALVRAYFAFLDAKSTMLAQEQENSKNENVHKILPFKLGQLLLRLENWQALLDLMIQVRPLGCEVIHVGLLVEAMDCIIIEIFDIYSKICDGIASTLMRIYEAGKDDAIVALRVLQKATIQGDELKNYFEICRRVGVLNATEFPKVVEIPKEDIRDLENIINGLSGDRSSSNGNDMEIVQLIPHQQKRIKTDKGRGESDSKRALKTVITDKWEVFEDDHSKKVNNGQIVVYDQLRKTNDGSAQSSSSMAASTNGKYYHDLPDLIVL